MKHLLIPVLLSFGVAASAADTYSIDPTHTHATFSFQHLGFSTFHGKIPSQRGTISLDREKKTGEVDVVFDLAALTTGVKKFDDHLRSKDFFAVETHPTATFKASKITFKGDVPASVTGDLTIKGISKPVTLQVTSFHCGQHPMLKVPACGANASATINRSDFGLTYALPAVKDQITLDIEVEAAREQE
ncbi:MAG TPA: YceI family protein [Steroidobacter sp.]|uniref:YceI family protein n=1 Tax=Steroidobacter sp. TaxID=1978227 RepID=UPI002ED82056